MAAKRYDIAVVGSGAAGSMGSLRSVLNNLNAVCFMGNPKTARKARATWVGKVENMPVLFDRPKAVFGSSRDVFKWIRSNDLWKQNLTEVHDAVADAKGEKGNFTLQTTKGATYHSKYILLCTGIMDIQPDIGGSIEPIMPFANEGHIQYCIRCDGHKSKGKRTAVIGHSAAAGWVASLLLERYDQPSMTVLTNGKPWLCDPALKDRLNGYGIAVIEEPIAALHGNPKECGLTHFEFKSGRRLDCEIAYVSLGTIVYNELAKSLGCRIDERGYVLTDDDGQTDVPGVFIGGDLRAGKKKQIYTAWDITVDAVDKIDAYIRAEKRAKRVKNCRCSDYDDNPGFLMG